MRVFCFLLTMMLTHISLANVEEIMRTEEVSLSTKSTEKDVIQTELLNLALVKAVKSLVAEQGHSVDNFEKALKEKFEDYFEKYKQGELTKRFGRDYVTSMSPEDKKSFLQGIEVDREKNLTKFSQYSSLLRSHQFKTFTPVPNSPQNYKASIELIFDRPKFERRVQRILSTTPKTYQQIRILAEMNLFDLTWKDLSLEHAETFTQPLKVSWEKFINENLPSQIEEATVCEEECLSYYRSWEEKSLSELQKEPLTPYSNDLWVKVSFNLKKLKEKSNGLAFEWDGRVVVIEVKSKRLLSSAQLHSEQKEWVGLDAKALNSALATRLYKTPLTAFKQLEHSLGKAGASSRSNKLVIKGHRHLGEVQDLIQILQTRGTSLGLKIELTALRGNEVDLQCFYQGEEKSFTDLLSQLKELKSSQTSAIIHETSGGHHTLTLVKP